MSLQSRLLAFFILIVVVPIGLFALVGQRVVAHELDKRTFAQLMPAQKASLAVLESKRSAARDRIQLIASNDQFTRLLAAKKFDDLKTFMMDRLGQDEHGIDFMVVGDPTGKVLVAALSQPHFLSFIAPPTADEIVAASDGHDLRRYMVTRSIVPIQDQDRATATVLGGYYIDNDFLEMLSKGTKSDSTLVLGGLVYSSTLPSVATAVSPLRVKLSGSQTKVTLGRDQVYAVAEGLGEAGGADAALVTSVYQSPVSAVSKKIRLGLVGLLFSALLGSGLLGLSLARFISKPLREVAAVADAISAGDYDQHIEVRSKDEVGQLANAFNEMSERLSSHISELKESREEVKRALTRFTETLRSTHDLDRLLDQVMDASVDALSADKGLLMWMNTSKGSVVSKVARGIDSLKEFQLDFGEGVAGKVAQSGQPIRLPEKGQKVVPSPKEPKFRNCLAVPIFIQEEVVAVLSLYDKQSGRFTEADLGTLMSLASQAGVAIDNVMLHNEAKRQAIMDPVTGVWNFRYFKLRYDQEIERSARFHRPFSLCLIDIDDFKRVNDTYGHQRGDAVLIELARRVSREIRDIDSLARYGGEEFVIILPETDIDGGIKTAEKVRAAISNEPFRGSPDVNVTISIGVAAYPRHGIDGETLYNNADVAMYAAKRAGKNKVVAYNEPALRA